MKVQEIFFVMFGSKKMDFYHKCNCLLFRIFNQSKKSLIITIIFFMNKNVQNLVHCQKMYLFGQFCNKDHFISRKSHVIPSQTILTSTNVIMKIYKSSHVQSAVSLVTTFTLIHKPFIQM